MGYREQRVPPPAHGITLDGERYDLDYFGMDDGRAENPDAAFRFVFQLGSGYMIYLYVIQTGAQLRPVGGPGFFHTFWVKDCAVVEVDMEDQGPPSSVFAEPCRLPQLYPAVTLRSAQAERSFGIRSQQFSAADAQALRMDFELEGGGRLEWTRRDGWRVAEGLTPGSSPLAPLAPGERLLFG